MLEIPEILEAFSLLGGHKSPWNKPQTTQVWIKGQGVGPGVESNGFL